MRLYLAAPLAMAHRCNELAPLLAPHTITSRWHATIAPGDVDPLDEATRYTILENNLDDLLEADVLVALTDRGTPRATYGEIVHAMDHRLPVVWVHGPNGEGRCIFDARAHRVVGGDGMADRILKTLEALQ